MPPDVTSSIDGRLLVSPFSTRSLADRAAEPYRRLLDRGHAVEDVLILQRFPGGTEEFATGLAEAASIDRRPNVRSVLEHATSLQAHHSPDRSVLSEYERFELLRTVIESWEWDEPYFRAAASRDGFGRDVGRTLLVASWGGFGDTDRDDDRHAALIEELRELADRFEAVLEERSAISQPQLVARGVEALRDPSVRSFVEAEFDAVLVVDFEEFGRLERAYLGELARNAELLCLGERDASVQRIWNEAGSVEVLGRRAGVSIDPDRADGSDRGSIAAYLATGDPARLPESSGVSAYRIDAERFEAQLERVANEIERLREADGYRYDDVAVLLKDSTQPIHEARSVLRRAGVETASATVGGLSDDPAVRELHALVRLLESIEEADRSIDSVDDRPAGRRDDEPADVLAARVGTIDSETIATVDAQPGMRRTLERWALETDLKSRIAREEPIDARTSFGNVAEVFEIAAFFDGADFLPPGYRSFRETLDRAISHVAPDQYATDLSVEENGVLVDAVRTLKHDSRPIVFLLDVVEGVYPPIQQQLTALFPTDWVAQMSGYPGVTTPTPETVESSFSAIGDAEADPYGTYYDGIARRQLAVGARAADDRLYFCTAARGTSGMGRRRHPSRYLELLADRPEVEIEALEDRDGVVHTPTAAAETIVRQPRGALERIERAASLGDDADVRPIREEFEAIAGVLAAQDVDPRFVDAVKTQVDLVNGEIGLEDPDDAGGRS